MFAKSDLIRMFVFTFVLSGLLAVELQGQGANDAQRRTEQMLNRIERQKRFREDQQRQIRQAQDTSLKPGQLAPTFTLSSLAGDETFDLRESRGNRPVVLIFGSYT